MSIKAKDKNNTALNITEEGRRYVTEKQLKKYTRDEEELLCDSWTMLNYILKNKNNTKKKLKPYINYIQ